MIPRACALFNESTLPKFLQFVNVFCFLFFTQSEPVIVHCVDCVPLNFLSVTSRCWTNLKRKNTFFLPRPLLRQGCNR